MRRYFVGMLGTLILCVLPLATSFGEGKTAEQTAAGAVTLSSGDKNFVTEAATGGQAEIELGQLAKDSGQSEVVKQFGQHMIEDHSRINSELSGLASRKGLTVPTTLTAKQQAMKDKLAKLSGAAFDKQYIREMIKDHEADVAAFHKEAKNGKDAELTAWVKQTIPTLQGHLTMARDAEAKLGGNKTAAR